nr:retrotransposon protein, putative, unclassified [Tanacetum cinerariifolium]
MSSKAFRVFNKRTKRVEENLLVDFLENKPIEKGAGPNWLFDIDSLTNSIYYVPVVVAGTNFINFSGTKEAGGQDVKKDVSSLRYIVLPNWFHEAHLESSTSNAQDTCSADAPESSGNSNPTATSTNPPANHMETLAVETLIPTVDVKSAFLYGTIDEEVYVMQPLGFQDLEFPTRVYKVEKVMYGLHQAPRAWNEMHKAFPLPEQLLTAIEDKFPLLIQSDATADELCSAAEAGDRPAERPTTNKAKLVKAAERPTTDKVETEKKPAIRYAEMYRRTSKRSNVRGNQRNWNNLKSYHIGPEVVLHKKPCFNCGDISHLANDCRKRVQRETTRSQNHAYMSPSHRSYGALMRPSHRLASHRPHGPPMRPQYRAP